jgi:hypothetical protein
MILLCKPTSSSCKRDAAPRDHRRSLIWEVRLDSIYDGNKRPPLFVVPHKDRSPRFSLSTTSTSPSLIHRKSQNDHSQSRPFTDSTISTAMTGDLVLITGATGHIGFRTLRYLLEYVSAYREPKQHNRD